MDYEKSIENVEKILEELKEECENKPIVVEGERDVEALRKLGFKCRIITANKGVSLINFCDWIARRYSEIIILTDWDKKGGFLCSTIKKNLQGRVDCNVYYRKILAQNSTTKKIEGVPSWIETTKSHIKRNDREKK